MKQSHPNVVTGQAAETGAPFRGWFQGPYLPAGLLQDDQVELKWGVHPARQERAGWSEAEAVHSLSILVRGHFQITFADATFELRQEGDFVRWGPDTPHTWRALAESIILTVRWPERPAPENP